MGVLRGVREGTYEDLKQHFMFRQIGSFYGNYQHPTDRNYGVNLDLNPESDLILHPVDFDVDGTPNKAPVKAPYKIDEGTLIYPDKANEEVQNMSLLSYILDSPGQFHFHNQEENALSGKRYVAHVEGDKVILYDIIGDKAVDSLVRQTPYVPFFEGWKRRNPQVYNQLWWSGAVYGALAVSPVLGGAYWKWKGKSQYQKFVRPLLRRFRR